MNKLIAIATLLMASPAFAASGPFFSLRNTNFVVLIAFLVFVGILVWKKVPKLMGRALDDRAQMIRGMVDGLAKRLADNPGDVQGWLRLVQSYAVLGERERATVTLAEARRKLAGNTAALGELAVLAKALGLGS